MTFFIVLISGGVVLIGLLAITFMIATLYHAHKTGTRIRNTFKNIEKAAANAAQKQP